jgi:cystathionine beta-synthase
MNLQSAIGATPLVELTSLDSPVGVRILAKVGFVKPDGGIKDRGVHYILRGAERRGVLRRDPLREHGCDSGEIRALETAH